MLRIVEKKYNTGKVEYIIQEKQSIFCFSWWRDFQHSIYHDWRDSDGKPKLSIICPTFKTLEEAQENLPHFEKFLEKESEHIISIKECSNK